MSSQIIWICVGIGFLFLILGIITGFMIFLMLMAKDKTIVRLREGEVIIQKTDLESLIKSAQSSKKRELLTED